LIRLAVRCRLDEAEAALAELLALAPNGIEEVRAPGGDEGLVEYAIYGAEGELPELGVLRAAAGAALVDVHAEPVADDWEERWKRFYHPRLLGGRLYVRPPWERPAERGGVTEVVIDPGPAFGTGTHPTTAMCLTLLLEEAPSPRGLLSRRPAPSLCDLGCGSGVLAIAGAKLGFAPVFGVDADRAALRESERNARLNGVRLELAHLDLRSREAPEADLVTANLTRALLEALARRWQDSKRAPPRVIASGFLATEADRVAHALARAGLRERRRVDEAEWSALLLA
jgi:ribosomal protein L11 methyltransferase